MDKLKAVEDAIAEILDDHRVTPEGDGYRVRRDDGEEYLALPTGVVDGDWAVFFGDRPGRRVPEGGLRCSTSSSAQHAVYWALL
jgi:hypothetical protein